jgi:hypothetical protein
MFNPWPTTTTPTMSPPRFPPQFPAHPGRKQDDGARQVSWLPGLCSRPPSQGRSPSGMWDDHSPVTVAGTAAVSHRVPIQIPCGNLARSRTIQNIRRTSIGSRSRAFVDLENRTKTERWTFAPSGRDIEPTILQRSPVMNGATACGLRLNPGVPFDRACDAEKIGGV